MILNQKARIKVKNYIADQSALQARMLYENNFGDRGNFECVGLDVKAMRTQPDEDCYRHLINSKKIFEKLLAKVKRFDYEFQAACVKEQNFEKLEMYVMDLLMGD